MRRARAQSDILAGRAGNAHDRRAGGRRTARGALLRERWGWRSWRRVPLVRFVRRRLGCAGDITCQCGCGVCGWAGGRLRDCRPLAA